MTLSSPRLSSSCALSGRLTDDRLLLRVRRAQHFTASVEHHRGRTLRRECRPVRQAGAVGIASARKLHPGIADAMSELDGLRAAAGHGLAALCIVEDERKLRAMERARPAIEHGRLPGKPIKIGWR